jgi:hypothetical protein
MAAPVTGPVYKWFVKIRFIHLMSYLVKNLISIKQDCCEVLLLFLENLSVMLSRYITNKGELLSFHS